MRAARVFAPVMVVFALVVAAGDAGAGEGLCLVPPLSAPVVDPFRAPSCPYCAGNRGIEYAPAPGTAVTAGAAGRVSFAGAVAGVNYVVVEHAGGFRTTYGRLDQVRVRAGATVGVGSVLGTSTDRFFLGVRLGEDYRDPAAYLASVEARPQLVPLDGRHRRPGRPARVVCPAR